MAETIYITRPKTKPSSSTKGKLNEWDNGYKEFVPAGTRESNRQMLKQMGDSSFYLNQGKKESSYSLHLNVDGDSADPVGEMFDLFKTLTEGERKSEPTLPEGEGHMLFDDGQNLKIWLDTAKGKVTIQAQLDCSPNIERMLLQAQAAMNVCIGRHRTEILKVNSELLNDVRV